MKEAAEIMASVAVVAAVAVVGKMAVKVVDVVRGKAAVSTGSGRRTASTNSISSVAIKAGRDRKEGANRNSRAVRNRSRR